MGALLAGYLWGAADFATESAGFRKFQCAGWALDRGVLVLWYIPWQVRAGDVSYSRALRVQE